VLGVRLFTLIVITLTSLTAIARQSPAIDSLENLLPVQQGMARFETLNLIAIEYTDVDNREAYRYARQLYPLSFALGDSLTIVKAGLRMGAILRRLEKTDSALRVLTYCMSIARRHQFIQELKFMTNSAGGIYTLQARYQLALSLLFESLEIRRTDQVDGDVGVAVGNIAVVYYKMKNYEKALEYFEQAITEGDDFNIANLMINRGTCKMFLNHEQQGLQDIWSGLKMKSAATLPNAMVNGYTGLGIGYFRLHNYKRSHVYLTKAIYYARKENNQRFIAEILVYFAKIEIVKGDFDKALDFLKEAEHFSTLNRYNELLITIYEEMIVALQAKSDSRISLYQQLLINLKQDVYNSDLRENLSLVESDLRKKENSLLLENQAQILRLNEALIDKNTVTVWTIIAVCFMIMVLLVALYRINKFKKDANASIEKSIQLQTAALEKSVLRLQGLQENKRVERYNFLSGLKRHLYTIDGLSYIMNSSAHPMEIRSAAETLRKLVVVETKQL